MTKDDALAALVPPAVSADGKIVFGTDASYPPNEFTDTDGSTIIGMDVDLGNAVAQKLGLTAEFQNAAFSGIIPGIEAAKYELGMSSFSINDERVQTVDMVSYFSAGTSLAVKTGNPDGINADDLCGKAVGVQAGTAQVEDLAARNTECTTTGKAADHGVRAAGPDRRHAGADREPGAGHAGRLAGGRVRGQDHGGRGGGARRALRHRAVRHRAGQEPGRLRQGRCRAPCSR